MAIIEIRNLVKDYKIPKRKKGMIGAVSSLFYREYETIHAVKDISLGIDKGEMVGYIGPNGAGKSTTIKIMCGILLPTSGYVKVNNYEPYKNRRSNATNIGVIFGQRTQLWWDIPVNDSFLLLKSMYRVSENDYEYRMSQFNEILAIDEFINTPVRNLSLGQKMRAEMCAVLLHNPSILYLDEPTIGLDIVAKRKIYDFIREMNKKYGTTVILTTHDINDVEKLCPRIVLIDKGRMVTDDSVDNLVREYGNISKMSIYFEGDASIEMAIRSMKGIVESEIESGKAVLVYDATIVNATEIFYQIAKVCRVSDFTVARRSTEEIIHDIYVRGTVV